MKVKNLFDIKNIKHFVILAVILFFVLPLLAPQKREVKVLKKEISADREESPLPIFPQETHLQKYLKQLKKFYGFEKETPQENEERPQTEESILAEDLFFSLDDEDGHSQTLLSQATDIENDTETVDNVVNLQNGSVYTSSGLLLEPTQEGYYYQGKFYKNGTYPNNVNKQEIEFALSHYHSTIAKYNGKKALYYADDKGNLTVNYVDEYPDKMTKDIDKYFAQNPLVNKQTPPSAQEINTPKTTWQNDPKYRGAQIHGTNDSSSQNNATLSDIALASLHDMHSAYNLANAKIKTGQMGQEIGIDINNHNISQDITKKYLDTLSSAQSTQEPETLPIYSGNQDDVLNIPVGKEKDFVEEFTEQISDLNCNGSDNISVPGNTSSLSNNLNLDMFESINVSGNTCSMPPVNITQTPENMSNSIVYNGDGNNSQTQQLTQAIAQKISESEKEFAEIISTQHNFPTLLTNQHQFINKNGENVTLSHIEFGPKSYQDPKDTKLSSYYESIINTIAINQDEANQLRETIDTYYDSVKDKLNKPTIFISAFNPEAQKIFIENNPRTGYIGPLPKVLKEKEGLDFVITDDNVVHNGDWLSYSEFMKIVDKGNVNMYIVPPKDKPINYESACTDNKTCFKYIKGTEAFSTQIKDISANIAEQIKLTEKGTKINIQEGKANAKKLKRAFGTPDITITK